MSRMASLGCWLVMLYGACLVAFHGCDFYMVWSGQVPVGEPMYLDQLAPSLADSGSGQGLGLLLMLVSMGVHAWLKRRKA